MDKFKEIKSNKKMLEKLIYKVGSEVYGCWKENHTINFIAGKVKKVSIYVTNNTTVIYTIRTNDGVNFNVIEENVHSNLQMISERMEVLIKEIEKDK